MSAPAGAHRPRSEQILSQPDLATPVGIRDRAILEILYSTGMRRKELVGLRLYHLDLGRGTVMIREGKGKKDRLLPLGERAAAWLNKYLEEARPKLIVEPDEREVFLCVSGRGLTPGVLGNLVHDYVQQSGIGKAGNCHISGTRWPRSCWRTAPTCVTSSNCSDTPG